MCEIGLLVLFRLIGQAHGFPISLGFPAYNGAMAVAAPMTPNSHREHLARADRHIAELRDRISHQLQIVERLRSYGISQEDREDLLTVLGESLRILQRHRELMREALRGEVSA